MRKLYVLFILLCVLGVTARSQVVINEVYGGGGNSGAVYTNDFVELYNNSAAPVVMTNWSLQYTSAAGSSWGTNKFTFSGTIPANGYFLIQLAAGATPVAALPTPDATGSINMSGTGGKILLANNSTTVSLVTNPTDANIVDKVGWGTANGYETAAAPATTNSTSVQRTPIGTDTNNNSADFTAGTPSPNNSGGGPDVTAPTINSTFPADNATGVMPAFTSSIAFSEPIVKGATGTITIKKVSDNSTVQAIDVTSSAVTVSGSNVTFNLQGLQFNTDYYIEITSGAFKDASNNNFAGITGATTWNFTTATAPSTGVVGSTYSFTTCSGNLPDGFTQYSVVGNIIWGCTTFGRDAANPPTGSAPNGVQINGFSGGTNVPNVDWLISPAFNLTGTTYPLLSFWSRTAFNGDELQLKISTNYSGTGDPNLATWTDLNGKFPAQISDVWALSENINLSAFKQPNVYLAWVYTSTDEEGARWTLDDILITNSATPPPPSLTVSTTDMQFTFVASGSTASKTFSFTGNDITGDVTLTSTGNFLLSRDGGTYSSTITYTQAEANNVSKTVFVQFAPTQVNKNYTGTVTITTSGQTATITTKGTSIDPANTLEVVNWNIEWFGHPTIDPANDALQEQNVATIMKNMNADLFALTEIVSEARLAAVVAQMPGYAYVISNYGSHTNPFSPTPSPLSDAQKLAFVYKTSVINNLGTTALLSTGINTAGDIANPAYNYFSSGRYPYMMNADVTLNGVTKNVKFVAIHGKANTSPTATSYDRRKNGSDLLAQEFKNNYGTDNIVLLGDFNDDLDQTITAGISTTTTSYIAFTSDNTNFYAPTLTLSLQNKKSTVSHNDVIDHVVTSNEMRQYYLNNSANILTDVANLVSNYANTTSDHYPVFTRYAFDLAILPVRLVEFTGAKESAVVKLKWTTSEEINAGEFIVQRSNDGRQFATIGTVKARGNSSTVSRYEMADASPISGANYYRLQMVDADGKSQLSNVVRIDFSRTYTISIAPNPVRGEFVVSTSGISGPLQIRIMDVTGREVKTLVINNTSAKVNVSSLSKGVHFVQVTAKDVQWVEKVVVE